MRSHGLLHAGADPEIGDTSDGCTPCIAASYHGCLNSLKVLLEYRADPNRADCSEGWTPCLCVAAGAAMPGQASGNSGACLRALADAAARLGIVLDVNAVVTEGECKGMAALDVASTSEVAVFLRDELGALRAADPSRSATRAEQDEHDEKSGALWLTDRGVQPSDRVTGPHLRSDPS